jgi:hypothetical protein
MSETNNEESKIAKNIAILESMTESDRENMEKLEVIIERIAIENDVKRQNRRHLIIFLIVVMIIVSWYVNLNYSIYSKIFTPKEYWTHEVQTLETLTGTFQIGVNKAHDKQAMWQKTYNDEFEKVLIKAQSSGMDKENAIKEAKAIMQIKSQVIQESLVNERLMLSQFKKDLDKAKQELSKYDK